MDTRNERTRGCSEFQEISSAFNFFKTKTKTTSQIKHTTDSKVRDTKYYRYLEPYFQNHPDIEKIMNQYGKLNISKLHGSTFMSGG